MQIIAASTLVEIAPDSNTHRARRAASWHGFVKDDNENMWGAMPTAIQYLYRGQNARHSPMLPSIGRGLLSSDIYELWKAPIADQAKFILRTAQVWWFSRELAHHPVSLHAREQCLDFDAVALAQHYGIPTGYLDLTDDFNVSAFFATCRETSNGWEPVPSETEQPGIIYRVELNRSLFTPLGRYLPIGPQRLPRPTEQCAWVAELPLCDSRTGPT